MAIQILSDLHLESPKSYDTFQITPTAPYLGLLGDIGLVARHKDDLLGFLTVQLRQFRAVLFVPGNHEAYHSSWPEVLSILRDFERDNNAAKNELGTGTGTFVLLDRAVFWPPPPDDHTHSTVVLGCSLFSAVPPESAEAEAVGNGLNDFYHTGADWDVAAHDAAHARDLAWLNEQVAELEDEEEDNYAAAKDIKTIIIFTHWSPTRNPSAVDPKHSGSPISSAFSTDLSRERCFTSPKVRAWAFGHTHYNCDFLVERGNGAGPLRLFTNQRGYYFQQAPGFDGAKKIDL